MKKESQIVAAGFDMEATLVDGTEPLHAQAYMEGARFAGVECKDVVQAIETLQFIGGSDERVAQRIVELSEGKANYEAVLGVIQDTYDKLFQQTESITPIPWVEYQLDQMQRWGVDLCMQTGTPMQYIDKITDLSGLNKWFTRERMVLPCDVKNGKPSPEPIIEVANRLDVPPERLMFFGDAPKDMQAARAAKAKAIGIPYYKLACAIIPLFRAGANRVYASWFQVEVNELIANFDSL